MAMAALVAGDGVSSLPLFEGEVFLGDVDVFLPPGSLSSGMESQHPVFPGRKIQISHRSPASDRCPPLSVLQVISAYSTAVVEAGAVELHLVAMESKLKGVPCFWCWSAQTGLYEACLEMLNQRCLALVFDLDETLVLTNNKETFENRMEKITSDLKNSELDATTEVALCNELYRVCEDSELLKDFTKTGSREGMQF
ncbi:hypothetical protein QYE76_058760 [Lolium multiflorum]|uniref:Uncharacterized protein n=1 Tax=Lolium multiflorum TaxID=4521 RepID=A0AAD8WQ71_LOLMU|nr:hypothetical protein QYE76_058753 [Lolium multiflorum]KAK1670597.1 hypothetical protein QYE76_058756 [Lolium multiflorum]KAK1670601.1 hypothetical protein QYE76_058760 [Lolium multiflorum]